MKFKPNHMVLAFLIALAVALVAIPTYQLVTASSNGPSSPTTKPDLSVTSKKPTPTPDSNLVERVAALEEQVATLVATGGHYTDSDAVVAMGPNVENNPLNHARYTNAEAREANSIGGYSFICGGCDLRGISFPGADFSNAWLRSADLRDADLTNANLTDANLTGTNLTGVVWFNTICPDGSNSNDNGGTCVNNRTHPIGLVAWWPGEGNADDIVNNNHGTLQGGTSFGPGVNGQAFLFDGVEDYITVPDSPILNITGDLTISLWAKRTVFDGTWSNVLSKGNNPIAYRLAFDPSNHLAGDFEHDDGSDVDIQGPPITDSNWHHYVYVRSGQTHKLLVDGVGSVIESFSGRAGDTTGQPLLMGVIRPTIGEPFPQFFGGLVDEVRVYNRALSDAEIGSIHAFRDSEWTMVQTAMLDMMSDNDITTVTASVGSAPATNTWNQLPTGTSALPLSSYLQSDTTVYYYCWDTSGRLLRQSEDGAIGTC